MSTLPPTRAPGPWPAPAISPCSLFLPVSGSNSIPLPILSHRHVWENAASIYSNLEAGVFGDVACSVSKPLSLLYAICVFSQPPSLQFHPPHSRTHLPPFSSLALGAQSTPIPIFLQFPQCPPGDSQSQVLGSSPNLATFWLCVLGKALTLSELRHLPMKRRWRAGLYPPRMANPRGARAH